MSTTPPPPPGSPPPPPGPYGSDQPAAPPPPPPSYQTPPSVTWGQTKPPPPPCPIGAWLMIGGAVPIAIGCFLPWASLFGESINGFTSAGDETSDGYVFIVLAAALLGFGIATLLAGRLLPIAILATIFAAFVALGAIADMTDINDLGLDMGAGLPIVLVGGLASLAGGIVALATRRR